ncbi:hypothetical protein C8F01DRAFT_1110469 [Mycena amicta]|nr:hypothetical protein C8F01DRAFT_1110469 [Mycena amicta]
MLLAGFLLQIVRGLASRTGSLKIVRKEQELNTAHTSFFFWSAVAAACPAACPALSFVVSVADSAARLRITALHDSLLATHGSLPLPLAQYQLHPPVFCQPVAV